MAAVVPNRRSSIWLLAATFGVVGLVGHAWIGHRSGATADLAAKPMATALPADRIVSFETPDASDIAPQVTAERTGEARVEQLSAAESVLFSTVCDLRLLAADTELDLTTKQWSVLAEIVVQAQAVRHAYEAQIAVAKETAPGRYRVEIPAYAVAGDELRRRFLTDLQTGLGAEAATEVMEKLGRRLEGRFAGFGVGVQTLEITGDPANAPADVQVARTARYWNSAEGTERVTTRREVHFPGAEDPTGESWSALLALVGKTG
jgi:hypothetical protein